MNIKTTQNEIIEYLKHIHKEDILTIKIESYTNEIISNSAIESEFTVKELVKEKLIDKYIVKKNEDLKTKEIVSILFDSINKCKEPLDIEKLFTCIQNFFLLVAMLNLNQ